MRRLLTHFKGDERTIHHLNTGLFIVCILAACLCLGEYAKADEKSSAMRIALMDNRPLSYQGEDGNAKQRMSKAQPFSKD